MSSNLAAFIDEFVQRPGAESRGMRELRDGNPDEFLKEALCSLHKQADSPGSDRLLRLVIGDSRVLERIADPWFLPFPVAVDLARRMQTIDPAMDVRLLRLLLSEDDSLLRDCWQATRILELVGAISDGLRIQPLLTALTRHTDARVRSKATLLTGRLHRSLRWLEHCMLQSDPRVRANAVEALWGMDSPDACALFHEVTEDVNHRVAANGIVGLHRARNFSSAPLGEAMAAHCLPLFRAAAAWAMGETGDPRFLPSLERITEESTGCIRRNALRARVRIRTRVAELGNQKAPDADVLDC